MEWRDLETPALRTAQTSLLGAQRFDQHKPARAVVPVPYLHHGYALEVQMVAVKGAGGVA